MIRKELKSPDCVGHLGNGVFVVVMPETAPDLAQALVGREQVRECLTGTGTGLDDHMALIVQSAMDGVCHANLPRAEFVVTQLLFQDPAGAEKLVHGVLSVYFRTLV